MDPSVHSVASSSTPHSPDRLRGWHSRRNNSATYSSVRSKEEPVKASENGRFNHLQRLWLKKRIKTSLERDSSLDLKSLVESLQANEKPYQDTALEWDATGVAVISDLQIQVKDELRQNVLLSENRQLQKRLQSYDLGSYVGQVEYPLEVRIKEFSFTVPVVDAQETIRTVFNSSFVYPMYKFLRRLWDGEQRRPCHQSSMYVLANINLVIEPGKSYLLLGPPGSGKTSLLRAITGILHTTENDVVSGTISYNGRTLENKGEFHIENAFSYISQLDKHSPLLTVEETFEFARQCKSGKGEEPGATRWLWSERSFDPRERAPLLESDGPRLENLTLQLLGLEDVKDTFVSRCSGGQYRRITVGEMLTAYASVLCGDEISNGLDASSTYDMVQILLYVGRFNRLTRMFSLLQPSPETVSLFDEVVVLAEGQIIYAGPVDRVEEYFADIGFVCPPFVDIADFIQMVSSASDDSQSFYQPGESGSKSPSVADLAEMFRLSDLGLQIQAKLDGPHEYLWKENDRISQHGSSFVSQVSLSQHVKRKYANDFFRLSRLIMKRFLTLWSRDKRVLTFAALKNVVMGVSVGGVYFSTTDPISIQGALFQALLFVVLGAMQGASALVTDRVIFYKHTDANFYSAWPFMFGRAISQLPQTTLDTVTFATILYFMIGLGGRADTGNYFVFISLLLVFAFLMQQQLAVFATFATAGSLNAYNAGIVLFLILFGGFIVVPEAIPGYYSWLYWWNPFAWTYRALLVNEFHSGRWTDPEAILRNAGFKDYSGEPYGSEWIRWSFCYTVPYAILCIIMSALGLTYLRQNERTAFVTEPTVACNLFSGEEKSVAQVPFQPVTLSFSGICYDVTSSKPNKSLRILENVSGIFRPGRLCALMGPSGSGKSTLCDVLALRKRSGVISGSVYVNGWPQESTSFRRVAGYVEQFSEQSPELTVFETISFSARLRLDPSLLPTVNELTLFVEHIMDEVDLHPYKDALVGTEDDHGLSFEQKKRLSIAVELAASPSVVFLDEPTTGLDARNALMIVRTLRKIASGGRTVVTTIHQPSSAVFGMFDDMLLLRNGEVVYFGELGQPNCSRLVSYFESNGAQSIDLGENPANWILREIESSRMENPADLYKNSIEHSYLKSELAEAPRRRRKCEKIEYPRKFPTASWRRRSEIIRRLRTIYWRSPTYNYTRLLVSLVIATVLGSAFIANRDAAAFSESDMRARVSVVFLSFIITGIMAIISVLPVMTKIRDMFYRHRDALMYDSASMGLALGVVEQVFIVVSTIIFSTVFLAVVGVGQPDEPLSDRVERAIGFWGFFTFNFAIYSYFGQLFVCLVESMPTAIILSSVFIGLNNFFSGLIVRPQFLVGTFYEIPYYITPGHYVYDGLIGCLYAGNSAPVVADTGSEFEAYLMDSSHCLRAHCQGTVTEFVHVFFGGDFGMHGPMVSGIVLGVILTMVRVLTWVALKYIRFG